MNKRDFLKHSGAALAGTLASHMAHASAPTTSSAPPSASPRTNWAGNYTYNAVRLDQPTAAADVPALVTGASSVKALGARHSFNGIADTHGEQVALVNLHDMTLDRAARTVTVAAGVTYGRLAPWLDAQGFAVHNLASLPHVSVVGATATATHGSGIHNGNLSTAVSAVELVKPNGETVHLSRAANPYFPAIAVGLGAFGVITRITLDVVPTFQIAQTVYENLSFDQLEHNLDAIFGSGYSVSLFTDWQHNRATQVWLKQPSDGHQRPMPPLFYGATLQTAKLHPITGHSAINCTDQQGIPGPWYERLPHFRMDFTPSSGQEIQTEYFVARKDGYRAIRAVEELRDRITPHLFVTELRAIAADNLWLSMAYQRDSLALHFTWKPEAAAVNAILPAIEAKLEPFAARPHWAKVFTTAPTRLQQLYPRYADLQKLARQYDPTGKFRNEYLHRNLML